MKPECHICRTASPFFMNKDGYDLYRCPTCELVFVYPQISAETLRKDFYSYESGYQSNRAKDDVRTYVESERAVKILDYLKEIKPGARFLDVGCAAGHFMYWAEKRGFSTYGVELNKRTADSAVSQGFKVFNGFLEEVPLADESFDVVFLGELIEHVNDPRDFLKHSARLLPKEGIVAITTPNIDCFWSRSTLKLYQWFGIPWSSVTPPYHLFQFNPANLDRLMAELGFEPNKSWYLRIPALKYELGMMHVLKRYKKSRKISDFLFMLFAYSLYVPLYGLARMLHPFLKKDFSMIKL